MVRVEVKIPNCVDRICVWPVMVYRRWKYGYSYRRIYLGQGEYTIVDPADYYKYCCFNWSMRGEKKVYYAAAGIKDEDGEIKITSMHRLIANAPKGMLVDHHNSKPLDNRSENLRLATHSQNNCNRSKRRNVTSSYLGVHFHKRRNRWVAQITHNRKRIYIGYFDNEIDAAKAYDEAAKKYHKDFARLNFPENRENT